MKAGLSRTLVQTAMVIGLLLLFGLIAVWIFRNVTVEL
jgi:hypothetical protein